MTKVEQLAQEQFNTFKNRLCEILSEIEEEHKSAFMQGYAQGETDEKFRTKQVVTKDNAELIKENAELKAQIEKMNCLLNEIYSEYGFSELVKIRNDLPIEIQEVIKEIKEND